jgi:4-hydroxy-tetrahydrodipicolinate reductase
MRLALHGSGRMGSAVARLAVERGHDVVATFDRGNRIEAAKLREVDCVVDFSKADAIDDLVDAVIAAKKNLVIGTTGWSDRLAPIRERCERAGIGVVHASNFSPGANILFALARRAGALIASIEGYESGIEERHHSKKADRPSGTALSLRESFESGGARVSEIAVSRVGSEFGLHTLFLDSADDVIEISHRARNRDGFARGAVLAAELVTGRAGFFDFAEIAGFGVEK